MQIAKQRSLSNHGQSQRRQVETTGPLELGVQEGVGGAIAHLDFGRNRSKKALYYCPRFSNLPAALDKTTEFGAQSNDQELASYTHHAEL